MICGFYAVNGRHMINNDHCVVCRKHIEWVKIKVVERGYPVYLNEDNEWRCLHEDVIIEQPCCSSAGSSGYVECGCGGMSSIYCNDCYNDDMRDYEINEIMGSML